MTDLPPQFLVGWSLLRNMRRVVTLVPRSAFPVKRQLIAIAFR